MTQRTILLFILWTVVASQEPNLERKTDLSTTKEWGPHLGKCRVSKLEDDMENIKMNKGEEYVFTLKQLKRKYPEGEVFEIPSSTQCEDILTPNPRETCDPPAKAGMCTGTAEWVQRKKLEMMDPESRERRVNTTGFHWRQPEEIQPLQIVDMQVDCRPTCKNWLESATSDGKTVRGMEVVKKLGGFNDTMTEMFGSEMNLCNQAEGWYAGARDRVLNIHATNIYQPEIVPRFHPVGFQKVKIPSDIYARILNNRKKLINEKRKFQIERCDFGMQNCQQIVESRNAEECHIVSRENYFYRPLERKLLEDIFSQMKPMAEKWIGNKIKLHGTSIYGIRRYTRGAWLMSHLDHLRTHVISAILNIKQDVEEDWPLQIFDHQGQAHEITLKPGEMIWYESASLVHGRVKPLKGKFFENIFVHYMPSSMLWYKEDWSLEFGQPLKEITLEDLIEADERVAGEEEKERMRMAEDEEAWKKILETMTVEERVGYLAARQKY